MILILCACRVTAIVREGEREKRERRDSLLETHKRAAVAFLYEYTAFRANVKSISVSGAGARVSQSAPRRGRGRRRGASSGISYTVIA